MLTKSLKARKDDLSSPEKQLEFLDEGLFEEGELPRFKDKIAETGKFPLKPKKYAYYFRLTVNQKMV